MRVGCGVVLIGVGLLGLSGCGEEAEVPGDATPATVAKLPDDDTLSETGDPSYPHDDATAASDAGPDSVEPDDDGLDPPAPSWRVRAHTTVPLLRATADGCLVEDGTTLEPLEERDVLAADNVLYLIDEAGVFVRALDVEELDAPSSPPPPPREGTLRLPVTRWVFGDDLCPTPAGELDEHEAVGAYARWHDANYRGFVVVDDALGFVELRAVDVPTWSYPWKTAAQLVKELPEGEGYTVGAAVLIAPDVLLTAAHVGTDETYCYSRHPNSGVAWAGGEFTCGNILGAAELHPDVDLAVVLLDVPEPPPYATLRTAPVTEDVEFYAVQGHTFHLHFMSDAVVDDVGNRNSRCDPWPDGSTFTSRGEFVSGGDSGGPVFVGDELAGIIHGTACRTLLEPKRSVFLHVPDALDWIEPWME